MGKFDLGNLLENITDANLHINKIQFKLDFPTHPQGRIGEVGRLKKIIMLRLNYVANELMWVRITGERSNSGS